MGSPATQTLLVKILYDEDGNMKLSVRFGIATWFALAAASVAVAQSASAPRNAAAAPSPQDPPMVPPAGPGVLVVKLSGPNTILVLTGHTFTSRREIEQYLAYSAAQLTIGRGSDWFTFLEERAKGETAVPVPARDPEGPRYSFRMKYFRPVWQYKTTGSTAWTRWSPFAGEAFPKAITDFEVTAGIVVRKAPMDDADPLAFEARALSDLLINQVSPPK